MSFEPKKIGECSEGDERCSDYDDELQRAYAEIERLEKRILKLTSNHTIFITKKATHKLVWDENDEPRAFTDNTDENLKYHKIKSEHKIFREALEWYADTNYERAVRDDLGYAFNPEEWLCDEPEILDDKGERARKALEAVKE